MKLAAWRYAALAAAFGLTLVALWGPVERWSDASFAWHMAQHLVLLFVVPLLVLLGHPFAVFVAIAGKSRGAQLVRATKGLHLLGSPPCALFAFVAVLWVSHFSPMYEAALANGWIHVAEHGLYLAGGTLFWLPVVGPPPLRPLPYPVRLLYLLVALPQGALLGFVLDSARAPLYAHYAHGVPFAVALADQRDAAAVMWIAGGCLMFGCFLVTLGVWARRESRAGGFAGSGYSE